MSRPIACVRGGWFEWLSPMLERYAFIFQPLSRNTIILIERDVQAAGTIVDERINAHE